MNSFFQMRGSNKHPRVLPRTLLVCQRCKGEGCGSCDWGFLSSDSAFPHQWEDVREPTGTSVLSLSPSEPRVMRLLNIAENISCCPRRALYECDLLRSCKAIDILDNATLSTAKYTDAFATTPFLPSSANNNGGQINAVPQGTAQGRRVGRSWVNVACKLKACIQASNTSGIGTMRLLWDNAPAQASTIPNPSSIFTSKSGLSPLRTESVPRWEILREWVWNNTNASNTTLTIAFDELVDLGCRVSICTTADTTGIYSNMLKGALILYYQCETQPTQFFTIFTSLRLYFVDEIIDE